MWPPATGLPTRVLTEDKLSPRRARAKENSLISDNAASLTKRDPLSDRGRLRE